VFRTGSVNPPPTLNVNLFVFCAATGHAASSPARQMYNVFRLISFSFEIHALCSG
jgi:hypothetical protein